MLSEKTRRYIYAPNYYSEFKCIADKCQHSCCIDWEICIDERTYDKYKSIESIMSTVKECEDGPCFALTANGRCPHLNASGLCDIILTHGEDYLSEICSNHPRFYNYINRERTEAGLGIVCEEACRLILENEGLFALSRVEELDVDSYEADDDFEFDPLPQRDRIISIIETKNVSFDEKLEALKTTFDIPWIFNRDEWLDRFQSLEILDPSWENDLRAMKGRTSEINDASREKYGKYYERLLTYFVYRHVTTAYDADNLRARLAFAILSVEMIRSFFEADADQASDSDSVQVPERLIDLARRYSAEIEYSEDNTAELVLAFADRINDCE